MCQFIFTAHSCAHAYATEHWVCLAAAEGKACLPGQLTSSTRTRADRCPACGGPPVQRRMAPEAWRFVLRNGEDERVQEEVLKRLRKGRGGK